MYNDEWHDFDQAEIRAQQRAIDKEQAAELEAELSAAGTASLEDLHRFVNR